jgi:CheY-like chemotaxis protein
MFQRVLLVDDNESDNLYHSIMFKRAGFAGTLHTFDNGGSALDYLRSADLTLATFIVLDINMPQMDGFAFAQAATLLVGNAPVEIVLMLTPGGEDQDRQHAHNIPLIRHFAMKPLNAQRVKELLALPQQP